MLAGFGSLWRQNPRLSVHVPYGAPWRLLSQWPRRGSRRPQKASSVWRVEKPVAEEPSGRRFVAWVVRPPSWPSGGGLQPVDLTGGYCWPTPKYRNGYVQHAFLEGKKAEETSPRKSTPRTLKEVGQQYPGVIFIVLSTGTTGTRAGCRTPEGIRQDIAPHAPCVAIAMWAGNPEHGITSSTRTI
jgi:hypothetical protein